MAVVWEMLKSVVVRTFVKSRKWGALKSANKKVPLILEKILCILLDIVKINVLLRSKLLNIYVCMYCEKVGKPPGFVSFISWSFGNHNRWPVWLYGVRSDSVSVLK